MSSFPSYVLKTGFVALFTLSALPAGAMAQQKPKIEVVLQLGHKRIVNSVAFSPGGRFVVSGSGDKTVKLWEVATGREVRTFHRHHKGVATVAFSPDGRHVLSGSYDNTLRLWEIASGREVRTFMGHSHGVNVVAFSPGGAHALSGGMDSTLRLWEVATGRAVRTFVGHSAHVTSLAFSPDGRFVVSGSGDKTVKLWEVSTGRNVRTFAGQREIVSSLAFDLGGRRVLSGSYDKTLKLWDVVTGREIGSIAGQGEHGSAISFSSDGRYVLSGSTDHALKLWEVATGREVRTFGGHTDQVITAAFSPDGQHVVSGSSDQTIKLWELATGHEVRTLGGQGHGVLTNSNVLSPDGRHMLSATRANMLTLWEVATGREARTFNTLGGWATRMRFSPDGRYALTSGEDQKLRMWEVATGREIRTFAGHGKYIRSLAFSPNGMYVLSGSNDKTLKLWEVSTGREVRSFVGHGDSVGDVAFSPDGSHVLSGSDDQTIKLWEVETGREVRTFTGHYSGVTAVVFLHDGNHAVSGSTDGTLRLWEVQTGRQVHAFGFDGNWLTYVRSAGDLLWPTSVALSSDSRHVLSGYSDGVVKLWEVANGRDVRTFTGHGEYVTSVAFSPDGRHVMRGGSTPQIWKAATGELLLTRVASPAGDWLAMTPAGFFDRTGDGKLPLHLVRELEIITVEQVFEHLYRPDLVQELLKGDPEGKHSDSAHSLNLQSILETGPPPQTDHLAEKDERAGDTARLSVRITGKEGGIGSRVLWRVNGVTQGNTSPPELRALTSPLASVIITETLKLSPGRVNIVEMTAYNRAGLVATPPLRITIDQFGATTTARPRLFALAIGIDKYRMKEYRLSYAAHDARTVAKALEAVGRGLFSEVQIKILTDEEASEVSISNAIADIAREVGPDDVFVMFLGGHGKSIAGRYYYYPQTLDFSANQSVEQNAIGQDKWEAWLARLAVQKSLLIIDTCEGDAFRGSRGAETARQTAMVQLQRATGRNVIAASRDAAYEGYQGHGVLTYALLEALDSGAGLRGDDQVRVTAVADHVALRVPEISQKSFGIVQSPTRKLAGIDFPIGIRSSVLSPSIAAGPAISKEPTHVLVRSELLRERPAADAPAGRELAPGTQVRAVEFHGAWVIVARDGQKLGYVSVEALVRLQ